MLPYLILNMKRQRHTFAKLHTQASVSASKDDALPMPTDRTPHHNAPGRSVLLTSAATGHMW